MEKRSKPSVFLIPRLEDVIFILVFVGAFRLGPQMLGIDSDLGRHLTMGDHILDTGSIPNVDLLSNTKPGDPRPPYEWVAQMLLAAAHRFAGLDGVVLLASLIIAAAFSFVYAKSVKISRSPLATAFIAILGIAASSIHWLPRPHVFTFLFLSIWIFHLEQFTESDRKSIWIFPLLMLAWVNIHGGFIFGFLAWLACLAGEIWDRVMNRETNSDRMLKLVKVGILISISSVITPDGWGSWKGVLGNSSGYILQNTSETMSPSFYTKETLPFLILLACSMAIPSLTHKILKSSQVILLTGMAVAGLSMMRNIPLFAIVAIPIISNCTQEVVSRFHRWHQLEAGIYLLQKQLRGRLWPILFVITMLAIISSPASTPIRSGYQFNAKVFPVSAANWLEKNPQSGNMFNEFNWGGYLEFRLWPEQLVFLDSQTDFYGEALMREYQTVISADPGWEAVIKKHDVAWAIIKRDGPLSQRLEQQITWEIIYQDDTSRIFRQIGQ